MSMAEDVLEPVMCTGRVAFASRQRGDGVCCVLCAAAARATAATLCVCVSDGTIATVSPPRRHRGDAVPATATTRVHPLSCRGGGDGTRGSCALEPTPSRERRRVDRRRRQRRTTATPSSRHRHRNDGAATAPRRAPAPRGHQFTPVHTSATTPPTTHDRRDARPPPSPLVWS